VDSKANERGVKSAVTSSPLPPVFASGGRKAIIGGYGGRRQCRGERSVESYLEVVCGWKGAWYYV